MTVTTQPQLFIGDMLQHLHNSQLAAAVAAAGTTKFTQLKNENKREDISTTSSTNSQIVQGNDSVLNHTSEPLDVCVFVCMCVCVYMYLYVCLCVCWPIARNFNFT